MHPACKRIKQREVPNDAQIFKWLPIATWTPNEPQMHPGAHNSPYGPKSFQWPPNEPNWTSIVPYKLKWTTMALNGQELLLIVVKGPQWLLLIKKANNRPE